MLLYALRFEASGEWSDSLRRLVEILRRRAPNAPSLARALLQFAHPSRRGNDLFGQGGSAFDLTKRFASSSPLTASRLQIHQGTQRCGEHLHAARALPRLTRRLAAPRTTLGSGFPVARRRQLRVSDLTSSRRRVASDAHYFEASVAHSTCIHRPHMESGAAISELFAADENPRSEWRAREKTPRSPTSDTDSSALADFSSVPAE